MGLALGASATALLRHTAAVTTVCFHPEDDLLASAGADRRIALWDVASGEHRFDLPTLHTSSINCLAFSPDGKTLASAGNDHVIRLWNLETRSLPRELIGHHLAISSLSFSPDGKTLASGELARPGPRWRAGYWICLDRARSSGGPWQMAHHTTWRPRSRVA